MTSDMQITPNTNEFEQFLHTQGYSMVSQLPSGQWIGIHPFLFTTGLVYGIDWSGIAGRYCYERSFDAVEALLRLTIGRIDAIGLDGDDPSGPWIKHKAPGVDISNPEVEPQE